VGSKRNRNERKSRDFDTRRNHVSVRSFAAVNKLLAGKGQHENRRHSSTSSKPGRARLELAKWNSFGKRQIARVGQKDMWQTILSDDQAIAALSPSFTWGDALPQRTMKTFHFIVMYWPTQPLPTFGRKRPGSERSTEKAADGHISPRSTYQTPLFSTL